eukprot:scaffold94687_cov63-Phaeocystis_antarctica.AAC.1
MCLGEGRANFVAAQYCLDEHSSLIFARQAAVPGLSTEAVGAALRAAPGAAKELARRGEPNSRRQTDRQTGRQFGRKTHSEQLGCCATHLRRHNSAPWQHHTARPIRPHRRRPPPPPYFRRPKSYTTRVAVSIERQRASSSKLIEG